MPFSISFTWTGEWAWTWWWGALAVAWVLLDFGLLLVYSALIHDWSWRDRWQGLYERGVGWIFESTPSLFFLASFFVFSLQFTFIWLMVVLIGSVGQFLAIEFI